MNPVKTITKDELERKLNRHDRAQVVNVLEPSSYHLGFIPGSLRIPVSQLEQRLGELDRNAEVVTYCAGYHCHASRNAAELLARRGFNVSAYEGGIAEWKEAGLPVDEAATAPAG